MAFSKEDQRGLYIISAVVLVVAAILLFRLSTGMQEKPDARGCFSHIDRRTVILLDHSEGVAGQTAAEIRERILSHVRENVAVGEMVSIFAVTDQSSQALLPIFEACKPKENGNILTEGVRSLKTRFEKKFAKPLDDALGQRYPESSSSPIAQAITDLTLSQNLRADHASLLVFSDLLENSQSLDMYRCNDADSGIQDYKGRNVGAQERPEFHNVTVRLNVIPRRTTSTASVACRDKFWLWFFGNNEGPESSLDVSYLPG